MARQSKPEWWRPIWICLAGEQPLPNILPALAFQPERVEFIHSGWEASRGSAQRCARFLMGKGISAHTHAIKDPLDPREARGKVVELGDRLGYGKVLVNWTGGTKIMALGAYRAVPLHVPRIYYDTRRGLLVDEITPWIELPGKAGAGLSLEDHLLLNADVRLAPSSAPFPDRTSAGEFLERALLKNGQVVGAMAGYRSKVLNQLKGKKGWIIPAAGIAPPGATRPVLKGLDGRLASDGMASSAGPFRPTAQGLDYLDGFWFEEFVGRRVCAGLERLRLKGVAQAVRRNLTIRWKESRARNEIDIAFIHQDRLFLISCTTAAEGQAAKRLVAVEEFAERLGGRFARGMLATTQEGAVLDKLRGRQRPTSMLPELEDWTRPEVLLRSWFGL